MKYLKPILYSLLPISYSQITCEADSEDATCLACSNIPQDLEGLDQFDFSPYFPVTKLKLKLEKEDQSLDEDLVELDVENRLKQTLRNLSNLEKDTIIDTLIIRDSEMDSIDPATFNNQNTLR